MTSKKIVFIAGWFSSLVLTCGAGLASEPDSAMDRGKYLVEIGGCNDCHTGGFAASGGVIPESKWLLGDSVGFWGPWGTSYAPNLRSYVGALTEEQWVTGSKALRTRPPMPWWSLNAMTVEDLKAMYGYIKSLDPIESQVPEYLPPDQVPPPPYLKWPSE